MNTNENEVERGIVINGKRYEQIDRREKTNNRRGFVNRMLAMSMMMYSPLMDNGYNRNLPEGTDIIKEYELIQRKASTLSRWERDQVVKIFEHNFKEAI